ncbi:unnamed protein product [Strongylus vulgaris]|uniref:Uncharacterized protein n=1 Tax=Strongylus vulgaris TaxID=40348 RepID=A0A3P7LW49_STRVU|nr:unnamed protein product [Strongylus vulgaris]
MRLFLAISLLLAIIYCSSAQIPGLGPVGLKSAAVGQAKNRGQRGILGGAAKGAAIGAVIGAITKGR